MMRWLALLIAGVALLSGCAKNTEGEADIAVAEAFIDAFYSFDSNPLGDLLADAGESKADMLFYQGWAQAGNYIVMNRRPCELMSDNVVSCAITVQDDLVLALGIDFDVTDTFMLTIEDGSITQIETSTDDPQLYHDASNWVWENRPDLVGGPCDGDSGVAPDPEQCVLGALEGYREYAQLHGLTPRVPD